MHVGVSCRTSHVSPHGPPRPLPEGTGSLRLQSATTETGREEWKVLVGPLVGESPVEVGLLRRPLARLPQTEAPAPGPRHVARGGPFTRGPGPRPPSPTGLSHSTRSPTRQRTEVPPRTPGSKGSTRTSPVSGDEEQSLVAGVPDRDTGSGRALSPGVGPTTGAPRECPDSARERGSGRRAGRPVTYSTNSGSSSSLPSTG